MMSPVTLHRVVRFVVNSGTSREGSNGFSARPAITGLDRFYEIELSCSGTPDTDTGYLVDIHVIDDLVRNHLVPVIEDACRNEPSTHPASLMPKLWLLASTNLAHPLFSITWSLTPFTKVTMNTQSADNQVILRQRYEFSASHRLHSEKLDPNTNKEVFGKCNNENGHGHNYHVEPCISLPIDALESGSASFSSIDDIVTETILDELDHKHLNADCEAFNQAKGGVMPSVENIARYCFEQLQDPAARLADGARLIDITVWETDRTSCTYPSLRS
jgi:6-pyruvoyltetrahydropterin/6-carboxytetrahydropterin synthase